MSQEQLAVVQEQLQQPEATLAIAGVSRELENARQKASEIANSLPFSGKSSNYRAPHPGSRPDSYAGGMDHEDYQLALHEYQDQDEEEDYDDPATDALYADLDAAESRLSELEDDKDALIEGDSALTSHYAEEQRKFLIAQAEELAHS